MSFDFDAYTQRLLDKELRKVDEAAKCEFQVSEKVKAIIEENIEEISVPFMIEESLFTQEEYLIFLRNYTVKYTVEENI